MDIQQLMQNAQLMLSVRNGDLQATEELLNSGADVNFVLSQSKSETPLHDAVTTGNPIMVKLLLSKGANSEARNVDNKKPIDLCSLLDDQQSKQAITAVFKEHFKKKKSGKLENLRAATSSASTIGTYAKRPGTAAVGQLYETKMLTMVLFRLLHDDQIEDFYLGNNLDEAGAFDDIVLKTCVGGETRVQCLQAKHREAATSVNFSDLVNMQHPKGDFHLAKYYDSYLKIRYMFSPTSDHVIFRGEYEQTAMELIIFTPALLNFPEKVHSEYTSTCNKFHTNRHGKTVQIECTQVLLESFINISKEWHKKVIAEILVRLILLQKYDSSNLNEAIEKLKTSNVIQMFTNKDYLFTASGLLKLFNNQQVWSTSNRNIKKMIEDTHKIVKEELLPSLDEHVKIVKDFFVVLRFYTEQATEDELEDIIRRDIKTRIHENDDIIFSKAHRSVEMWWKQVGQVEFLSKKCEIFSKVGDEVKLEEIHSVSLNRIKSNVIKFRAEEVKNSKWTELAENVKKDKQFFTTIFSETPDLSCLKIIQFFQFNEDEYKFLIINNAETDSTLKVLSDVKPQCLIIVYLPESNSDLIKTLQQLVNKLVVICKQNFRCEWESMKDEVNGLLDLEIQCQEKLLENLITFQGSSVSVGSLIDKAPRELIDAFTLQKLVYDEQIAISKCWYSMDDNETMRFYIERVLLEYHNNQQISKSIAEVGEGLVIVAAEPGMGKSTLLMELASAIKSVKLSNWIVRMNLMDYSTQFHQWNRTATNLDENDAMILLINAMSSENNNRASKLESFERKIFRWYCKQSKIILLVDGFDEISPDYTSVVLQLLNFYKDNFIAKLWVTTRSGGVQKQLEKSLKIDAYSLKPFTMEQSKLFLWNYWKTKLNIQSVEPIVFDSYVKQLLAHLSRSIDNDELDLISVPLQIKMIAMVFQDNFETHCSATDCQPKFEELDLVALYEKFIDLKFHVVLMMEKNKIDITIPNVKQQNQEHFHQFQTKHKHAAAYALFNYENVKIILSQMEIKVLMDFLDEVNESVEISGIITKIVDRKPIFVHQTYAEFFAAQLIWEKYSTFHDEEFAELLECILINGLIKNEQAQLAKFLQVLAQKKIENCSNVASKACSLLNSLLNILPESCEEYNSRTYTCLLGIVNCSISANSECIASLMVLVKGIQDKYLDMLLMKASEAGYIWLVRLVMDYRIESVNVTFGSSGGWTALHFAINGGHTNVVEQIVRKSANINVATNKNDQTALHMATEKGYSSIVQLLLDNGAIVDASMSNDGTTPLHLAAREGHVEIVAMLLDKGVKIDHVTTIDGESALHTACGSGNRDIVQLLIEHGFDVNLQSYKNGSTPLHVATRKGHFEIVNLLLNNGSKLCIGTVDFGYTALHWAARENMVEIASLLLDKGASIDSLSKLYGQTPLHIATAYEHIGIVELLLNRGANVNIGTEEEGWTPLHLAARNNFCEVATMLLARGANIDATVTNIGITSLHLAVEKGHFEIAQLLLGKGANVNIPDRKEGWTVLHLATINNSEQMVSLLFEYGARVDCDNTKGGETALGIAIRQNNPNIVHMLMDNGATVCADEREWTPHEAVKNGRADPMRLFFIEDIDVLGFLNEQIIPLLYACLWGHANIAQQLLDRGADIHVTSTTDSLAPLHWAATKGWLEVIRTLVDKGANVNGLTKTGKTPLQKALGSGRISAVKLLLDLGANANLTECDISPLHSAVETGNLEVVQILVNNGANILAKSEISREDTWMPVHIAAANGYDEILEWLLEKMGMVDATTDNGLTALSIAAKFGRLSTVKLLLKLGANVNLGSTKNNYTPLHFAARKSSPKIAEALLKAGANANSKTVIDGRTALHEVLAYGRPEEEDFNVIKVLLEGGANVNARTTDSGHIPLQYAVRNGSYEIVRLLLDWGAITTNLVSHGFTPLYEACRKNHVSIAKLLLEKVSNISSSKLGLDDTPLLCAARNNFEGIVELLCKAGADVNYKSSYDGRTPLIEAARRGYSSVVKILLKYGASWIADVEIEIIAPKPKKLPICRFLNPRFPYHFNAY